ncbi:hypothetical protein F4679DRAFT_561476 [Xylaria curta]|nr:hypothetical protein F4679DRAFT_561476 [Xylaria curta]
MLAPWHRMKKPFTMANESLLLDYLDMLPPAAVIRALKYRDCAPAAVLTVSLLLQVVVTLSTSLIQPRLTQIESSVSLELKTRFHDVGNMPLDVDLAYFTMAGLTGLRIPYPEGTTAQYAHQTLTNPPAFGTNLRLEVDAFAATLDCENPELKVLRAFPQEGWYAMSINITVQVRREDCSMTLTTEVGTRRPRRYTALNFVRMMTGPCGNLSEPSIVTKYRASILVGRLEYTIDNTEDPNSEEIRVSRINITSSFHALCVPKYGIRPVRLVQNATSVQDVSLIPESNSYTLDNVKAWDFMLAQNIIINGDISNNSDQIWEIDLGDGSTINFDSYSALTQESELYRVPYLALTDATLWLDAIPRYFQKFSAQIAKNSILESVSTTTTGNQTRDEDRLIVVGLTCYLIEALLGLCVLLSIIIVVTISRNRLMETNPTSILGTARTATEATSLLLCLRNQGLSKSKAIQRRLGTAAYMLSQPRPNVFRILPDYYSEMIWSMRSSGAGYLRHDGKYSLVLHPASRTIFLLSLGGSIVVLQVLLELSQNSNGIGRSDLNKYLQHSWTLVPSILFTVTALVASSIDGSTRSLTPFLALKRGGSLVKTINFELLDGSRPRMLLRALEAGCWPAVFTIAAFLASSTFNIFSGSLYMNQHFPIKFNTTLRANTTFIDASISSPPSYRTYNPLTYNGNVDVITSLLILECNGSFQPFTYQNLAFPSLFLEESAFINTEHNNTSNDMIVVANIPALRPRLQCRLYSGEQIQTNLTLNYKITKDDYSISNPLRIDIDSEHCRTFRFAEYLGSAITIPTLKEGVKEGEMTFGVSSGEKYNEHHDSTYGDREGRVSGCGTALYAWGRVVVDSNGRSTIDAFALGCNETIEVVDVEVRFNSTALVIDSSNPPVPDEDSARLANFNISDPQEPCYKGLLSPATTNSAQLYDNFFALLKSSPWAVSASDLTNITTVDRVVAAIHAQHGLIRANYLNAYFRTSVNDLSPDVGSHVSPHTFVYSGNATVFPGRPRVVQDLQVYTRTPDSLGYNAGLIAHGMVLDATYRRHCRQPD